MRDKVEEYGKECVREYTFNLVTKNRLTMQEAAEELNMSLSEFKQAYNEYTKAK